MAGGNDSQDSSHKIHLESVKRGWEMRVIGVPKTIDNDLPHTDHTRRVTQRDQVRLLDRDGSRPGCRLDGDR